MRYEIDVIEHGDGVSFALTADNKTRVFGELPALDIFEGGTLTVHRDNKVFSSSPKIHPVMWPITVFDDLHELFTAQARPQYLHALNSALFEAGDKIILDAPYDDKDHLVAHLDRQERARASAAAKPMPVPKGIA